MSLVQDVRQAKRDADNLQYLRKTGAMIADLPGFLVLNTEAVTLPRFSVVELIGGALNSSTYTSYWMSNETIINARKPITGAVRLGILTDSILAGKVGRAEIAGILKAKVNISSTSHEFATIANGSENLVSAETGEFYLLNCTGTTGLQYAYVSIAGGSGGGSSGNIISIGYVVTGSASNSNNYLMAQFDPAIGVPWDYSKTDYAEDDVVSYDDGADVLDYTAKADYVYPPTTKDAWSAETSTYAEGDIVKDGDPIVGYIAKDGYVYPTNPYDPETEPDEYAAWVVPAPGSDPNNWDVWMDYAPADDPDNWEPGVKVFCIIYGTTVLSEAIPFFLADDQIMCTTIGSLIYFVGFCQKWGSC